MTQILLTHVVTHVLLRSCHISDVPSQQKPVTGQAKRLGINGQRQALQRHQASLEDPDGSSDQDFSW